LPATVFAGAVNETVALLSSTVAIGEVGAFGTVAGVTGPLTVAVDDPVEFVATVEKLYAVPLASPAIVQEVAGAITSQLPAERPVAALSAVTV
jgi:hypothetical protein